MGEVHGNAIRTAMANKTLVVERSRRSAMISNRHHLLIGGNVNTLWLPLVREDAAKEVMGIVMIRAQSGTGGFDELAMAMAQSLAGVIPSILGIGQSNQVSESRSC